MEEWIARHGEMGCGNEWVSPKLGRQLTAEDFSYKLPKDQR